MQLWSIELNMKIFKPCEQEIEIHGGVSTTDRVLCPEMCGRVLRSQIQAFLNF